MADLTVHEVEVTDATRRHPLATQTGLFMLGEYLAASVVWSGCTKPQRRLITDLCQPVMANLLTAVVVADTELPHVPHDRTPVRMRTAMHQRGLIDTRTGRLTAQAVHAYYWQVWRETSRAPRVVDVHLPDIEEASHVG